MPLQSLALLNSEFVRARAQGVRRTPDARGRRRRREAARRSRSASPAAARRSTDERAACEKFLGEAARLYAKEKDADARAWADLCQMLLASNAFLYVE